MLVAVFFVVVVVGFGFDFRRRGGIVFLPQFHIYAIVNVISDLFESFALVAPTTMGEYYRCEPEPWPALPCYATNDDVFIQITSILVWLDVLEAGCFGSRLSFVIGATLRRPLFSSVEHVTSCLNIGFYSIHACS